MPKKQDTNHWCFYLVTDPKRSVRLDCTPEYTAPGTVIQGGYKANIIFSELPYLYSRDAQTAVKLDVVQGLTVKRVCDAIIQQGYHQYEFNATGTGCRKWSTDQITLFQDVGFLRYSKQADEAREKIKLVWPKKKPIPLDTGAYYT